MVLSESADFVYKTTDFYAPECDRSIRWDDPDIGVEWMTQGLSVTISAKDEAALRLRDAEVF
ncbi:dTDP-4-dehydrorhamnose 3,5-epimerase [compost metagenome]